MYLYLTLLASERGDCHPTIEQIRDDLGLLSTSMVFEALTVLETFGFIVRERHSFAGTRAKRNVYQRTPCAFTVLRLLEHDKIDEQLNPKSFSPAPPAAPESKALAAIGLRELLGEKYHQYESATKDNKREILIRTLRASLGITET